VNAKYQVAFVVSWLFVVSVANCNHLKTRSKFVTCDKSNFISK